MQKNKKTTRVNTNPQNVTIEVKPEVKPESGERRLSVSLILTAIESSYGNITVIAQRVKCDRKTIYEWVKKEPELKAAIDLERERICDLAENKLVKKINDGCESLIALTLKTLGRDRGYGDTADESKNAPQIIFLNDVKK